MLLSSLCMFYAAEDNENLMRPGSVSARLNLCVRDNGTKCDAGRESFLVPVRDYWQAEVLTRTLRLIFKRDKRIFVFLFDKNVLVKSKDNDGRRLAE
jgi:hypothetical protein